ncbi:MFS transporter [Rhizobium sp. AP16]|uniref:MFS transporter n=1 Tax=Rhizobium sp. AP16 TaxID=1144306 RepID=UPI00026EE80B|nr:MFS transporter [Rhizobium sp. AP16]EJK87898.1 arabinose efflux permease family protein [Rhizobium sp. AP16]
MIPKLPRQLWLLAAIAFVNFLGFMVTPFLVLYLTSAVGLSIETAGIILTVFGLGSIFGAWAGGHASDRIGSENVLILSFLASAATLFLIPALGDSMSIGAAVAIMAFANGAFRPAYDACVVRLCPQDERSQAYAVYVVAINVGAGMAAAMAGHLYARQPSLIFFIDGLTSVVAAIAVLVFLDRSAPRHAAPAIKADTSKPAGLLYRNMEFLLLCLAACVLDMVGRQTSSTLPLFVKSYYGMTPEEYGNLLTLGHFVFAAAILPVSRGAKSKNHMTVVLIGMMIVAVSFGALPLGGSVTALVTLYLLLTAGQLMFYPAIMAMVMGQAARSGGKSGAYMSFYRTAQAAAGIVAPAIGTFIYVHFSPSSLWLGCSVITVLCAILLAMRLMLRISPDRQALEP